MPRPWLKAKCPVGNPLDYKTPHMLDFLLTPPELRRLAGMLGPVIYQFKERNSLWF